MTPERWERVRQLFDVAIELSPPEAGAYVARECDSDDEIREQLERMLEQHQRTGILDVLPPGVESHGGVQTIAVARAAFAAGQIVAGRYRIIRYVSRGGMGEVYEAEDLDLNGRVALKTILPAIASDERMVARFKREIQLARKIAHPNVCRVHDLARHPANGSSPNATLFLTMEFLSGETLTARLALTGRMSTTEAKPLLEQMAEALSAAHSNGVIHRDFKDSNVMLVPSSGGIRAVVTDFGLAHNVVTATQSTATLSNTVVGTLNYMAPELLSGADASFRSDVYALGMVAYKMVTGTLPFASEAPLAAAMLRATKPVPSPRTIVPDLDPNWERAIMRAIDPKPANRTSDPRAFAQALSGGASSITLPLPRSRRWLLGIAIVLLAVLSAVAGRWVWEQNREHPPAEAVALYKKGVDNIHAGAYFAATSALEEAIKIAPRFSLAHARLAEALAERDLAEKATKELLVARRGDLSRVPKIQQLQIEAIDYRVTREFASAAAKYEQMLALSREPSAGIYLDLGRA